MIYDQTLHGIPQLSYSMTHFYCMIHTNVMSLFSEVSTNGIQRLESLLCSLRTKSANTLELTPGVETSVTCCRYLNFLGPEGPGVRHVFLHQDRWFFSSDRLNLFAITRTAVWFVSPGKAEELKTSYHRGPPAKACQAANRYPVK